jgi:hypothetical protein
MALAAGQKSLAPYSHRLAPKKYTQPQLFACLVLKSFFRTDYRGMVALLHDLPQLQRSLGLSSVPHYTTLQKACARLLKQACCDQLLGATLRLAQPRITGKRCAAIDSSGFDCGHTSRYFVHRKAGGYSAQVGPRARQKTTYRRYGKLHLVVDCATHLAVAMRADQGPRPDGPHFECLLTKALQQVRLNTILADGGYDAEAHHQQARNQRQVRSVIPALVGRRTAKPPSGYWRRRMRQQLATSEKRKKCGYGQRWQVETVFSQIKRRLTSEVAGRSFQARCRDLRLLALTHNILILRPSSQAFLQSRSVPVTHGHYKPGPSLLQYVNRPS